MERIAILDDNHFLISNALGDIASAAGLARYGLHLEACRIATALIEASPFFRYRLPEAFAGYPRACTRFPVEYPTACSPQAWAASTVLLLIRTVLGREPGDGGFRLAPRALLYPVHRLRLWSPGARRRFTIALEDGQTAIEPIEEVHNGTI